MLSNTPANLLIMQAVGAISELKRNTR